MRNDPTAWDERYAASSQVWSVEPNAVAAAVVTGLAPGRALDLATGEGRMALWLASQGWTVTALDFSSLGLAKGRARAVADGLEVGWRLADVTTADLGVASFDLVLVLYLHLPRVQLSDVLERAAAAVAPGGHLVVLGHDRDNLARGVGGPQDEDVLYDVDLLTRAATDGGVRVLRAEQVDRSSEAGTAVDTLLVAERT